MPELLQVDENTELIQKALQRDRNARKAADRLLENKSRELFESRKQLQAEHDALKQTQAMLVQSEKMASLGQLAAGVAHEINNPVGFVASNLTTLTDYVGVFESLLKLYGELAGKISDGESSDMAAIIEKIDALRSKEDIDYVLEDVQELLSESSDGLVRVRDIVQNLKSFARLDEAEVKHVNLNETIESTLKIADNELKYHWKVVREFGDLPLVHCNAGKLNQVFLNLLVNAGQATSENGVITIGTHVDGDDVIIRIADNGSGILEENLTAIFNPFFTTKPVGEGTGLGLSISYNIIEQHGGQITVKSDTDVGTEFTIRLPIKGVTE